MHLLVHELLHNELDNVLDSLISVLWRIWKDKKIDPCNASFLQPLDYEQPIPIWISKNLKNITNKYFFSEKSIKITVCISVLKMILPFWKKKNNKEFRIFTTAEQNLYDSMESCSIVRVNVRGLSKFCCFDGL